MAGLAWLSFFLNLALDALALGAHLDGALQLALKLGAGGPRKKGFWKTIVLLMTPLARRLEGPADRLGAAEKLQESWHF